MNRGRKGAENILQSLIFITGALLLVALMHMGYRMRVVSMQTMAQTVDPYPQLYAAPVQTLMPEEKTVYLTFDDGPSQNTEKLLDLLQKEEIKATFFVCVQGEDTEFIERMLRRMRDEGHTIGLHSYTHRYEDIYRSLDDYLQDIAQLNDFIFEATGVKPEIVRFPGGSTTRNADRALMRQIADEMTGRGYVFFDWTVVSGDDGATAAPVETIAGNIVNGVQGRQVEIILCHDNPTPVTTPDAVRRSIEALREQGYAFDKLTSSTPAIQRIYE